MILKLLAAQKCSLRLFAIFFRDQAVDSARDAVSAGERRGTDRVIHSGIIGAGPGCERSSGREESHCDDERRPPHLDDFSLNSRFSNAPRGPRTFGGIGRTGGVPKLATRFEEDIAELAAAGENRKPF